MLKMPPMEKIPEAYTTIEDGWINLYNDYALVKSSNNEKEYLIKWQDNIYYSNDNSTYWQGYPGYPIIAVLMLQGKISLNREISKYFQNINWHELNKQNKRNYQKSLEDILKDISPKGQENINKEIKKVFMEIQKLDIELTRKKLWISIFENRKT